MLYDNALSFNANILYCWSQIWLIANAINVNSQWRERFHKCQKLTRTLQFIQDVITRWGSTYCMAIRALYLRSAVDKWIDDCDRPKLKLLKLCVEEWKHVEYMIALLYSFYWSTRALSKFTDPTIHWVWAIYNSLFQHLENWHSEAGYEPVWKNGLQTVIENAQDKFDKYYKWTEHVREELYAVAVILDSYLWMNAYRPEHWEWKEQMTYQAQIVQFYKAHYMQYESSIYIQATQTSEVEITILSNRFEITH